MPFVGWAITPELLAGIQAIMNVLQPAVVGIFDSHEPDEREPE
jgi:hypothetical protein